MAQHHRLLDAHSAEAAIVVIMQIGPANAATFNPDLDIMGPHGRQRDVLHPQIMRRMDNYGFNH
jgi:hypothetical protein